VSVNRPTQEPGPVEGPFKRDLRNVPVHEGPLFAAVHCFYGDYSFRDSLNAPPQFRIG
jgi:hypothetical protein